MIRRWSLGAVVLAGWLAFPCMADAQMFVRGDANNNGSVNIADPISILNVIYNGGVGLPIPEAGDANDNGTLEITDATYMLNYLFTAGAPQPPAPFPTPGLDTTGPNFPAAPTGEVEYRIEDATGCGGSQAVVGIYITNTVVVEATNMRIVYDENVVSYFNANAIPIEGVLSSGQVDFFSANGANGVITIGAIFNLIDPSGEGLQPSVDVHAYNLVFNVGAGVTLGTSIPIAFEDDTTSAQPSYNLASVAGQVVLANTTDGSITSNCMSIEYLRGDHNEDSTVSVSDAAHLVNYLFLGGPASGCARTGDTNGSNNVDVADVVHLLNAIFGGSTTITPPFPSCGPDTFVSFVSCDQYNGNCP